MNVLHYHVNLLSIPERRMALDMKKNRFISQAIVCELDETHWLVDSKFIPDIERQCQKLNIQVKVKIHGQ